MHDLDTLDIPSLTFSHPCLERVIYGHTPIAEIVGYATAFFGDYVVADFVGSHQIDQDRFAAGDLIQASARIFFEDSGAFVTSFEGESYGKPFNLVLFATFAVIEIAPYTPKAKFVVLAPPSPSAEDSPYAGLMRANNTDRVREQLEAEQDLGPVFNDLQCLLESLARAPEESKPRGGLLQRLFKR